MAIELIGTLKQKNNGEFGLIDSNDIIGGFYQADTITERNSIPSQRRKEGMFCWVTSEKLVYQLVDGITNDCWIEFKSGTSFNGGNNDNSGGETDEGGTLIEGYAHIWVGTSPPSNTDMIWLDTNKDGIVADEDDIYTVSQLITKINEMENIIVSLEKRIKYLEEHGVTIPGEDNDDNKDTSNSILLEDGTPILLEDGSYLLLE